MTKLLTTLVASSVAFSYYGSTANAAPETNQSDLQSKIDFLIAQVERQEERIEALETSIGKKQPAPTQTKAPAPAEKPAPAPSSEKTYVISEGDTISSIAKKHDVSRADLLEANNLQSGQQIYIGDQIVIPSAPAAAQVAANTSKPKPEAKKPTAPANDGSFTTYKVRYGDTLSRISRIHGVSVAAIKSANGLRSDSIAGGQELKIPAKGATTQTASAAPAPAASSTQTVSGKDPRDGETYGLYTVQQGDTIYSLAKDFYTTQKEIQRLNELKSTRIFPGDELIVPTSQYYAKNNLAQN